MTTPTVKQLREIFDRGPDDEGAVRQAAECMVTAKTCHTATNCGNVTL